MAASRLGLVLACAIGVFGALGVMALPEHGEIDPFLRWFHLDRELNLVTLFSAVLLIANGWLTAKLVKMGWAVKALMLLAMVFVYMGLDEALKFHETLEKVTGIDWQILYLPLMMVAGCGWGYVWWNGKGLNRWLWVGGAAAWVISQLLEACQWGWWWSSGDAKVSHYDILMVSEEILEMTGSALFLMTLFRLVWPALKKNEAVAD